MDPSLRFAPACSFVSVLLLLTLIGCGEGNVGPSSTATVTMSASGYPIVENTEVGLWDQAGETWVVEEDLRIGALDGDGPEVFGRLIALRVDDAGNLFVLDNLAAEVRVFDPAGTYLRTFGGDGDGPGELRRPTGLAWGPNQTLLVYSSSTFDRFDTTGRFIDRTERHTRGVAYPWPGQFDPEGRLIDMGVTRDELPENATDNGQTLVHLTMFRISDDFSTQDTLPPLVYSYPSVGRAGRIPFSGNLRYYFAPDGTIWFGESGDYRMIRRTLDGDTLLVFSLPHQRLRVSEAEKDSVVRLWAEGVVPRTLPADRIPDEKDSLGRMVTVDDLGRLWVAPFLDESRIYREFDVFDPDGHYLGRVELPFRLDDDVRMTVRDGRIYGVTLDDFDVPYVVRARLVQR